MQIIVQCLKSKLNIISVKQDAPIGFLSTLLSAPVYVILNNDKVYVKKLWLTPKSSSFGQLCPEE